MKKKQINKTLVGKTGKDLLGLMGSKKERLLGGTCYYFFRGNRNRFIQLLERTNSHEAFGVKEDFFQVGGNSLKAIQLLSRLSGSKRHI